MPISAETLKTRFTAFLETAGIALDRERRAFILAALESLKTGDPLRGHPLLLEHLSPEAEPEGHAGFLRSLAREK